MGAFRSWAGVVLGAVLVCCSAGSGDDDADVYTDDDGAGGGLGGGFDPTGGSSAGGMAADGCSDAARLIYVLSDANELYGFQPLERQFTKIGTLGCQTSMQPNSMAIDRDAVAWVNYVGTDGFTDDEGALYKVSTSDASCEAAPAVTLPFGWYRVGMGFATDGPDTEDETLFVTSISPGGSLGRIDMQSSALVPVGAFGGQFSDQNAELTGTGDARLFGFFTSTPVAVAEIDRATGAAISSTSLPEVEVPTAWAFSFWGGDFYLYTAQLAGSSRVNRYRPSDGSVDTAYMENLGFVIVGAGVSTCAPLEPPK